MTPSSRRIGYQLGIHPLNNVTSRLDQNAAARPNLQLLRWLSDSAVRLASANPASLRAAISAGNLEHESMTSERFVEQVARMAAGLAELGVGKGDRALIFVSMSMPLYVSMFALQRLGAIPVFLDAATRKRRLAEVAAAVQPRVIIGFDQVFALCEPFAELATVPVRICVGPTTRPLMARFEDLVAFASRLPACAVASEHTAWISYRMSAAGHPQATSRSHRALAAQQEILAQVLPYDEDDVELPVSAELSVHSLTAGIPTVLPAILSLRPDPAVLIAQALGCDANCLSVPAETLRMIGRHCAELSLELPLLHRISVPVESPLSKAESGALAALVAQAFPNASLGYLYGIAEAMPLAVRETAAGLRSLVGEAPGAISAGQLVPGLRSRLIRATDEVFPNLLCAADWESLLPGEGDPGELLIAGDAVSENYHADPVRSRQARIVDEDGTIWLRTGEAVTIDANGELSLYGKVDLAFRRANGLVFPDFAERVIRELAFVADSRVVGVLRNAHELVTGAHSVAVIVPHDPIALRDAGVLAEWEIAVRSALRARGVPVDSVRFQERLPATREELERGLLAG